MPQASLPSYHQIWWIHTPLHNWPTFSWLGKSLKRNLYWRQGNEHTFHTEATICWAFAYYTLKTPKFYQFLLNHARSMTLPREGVMSQITNNICIQGKRKCSAFDILVIWLHHNWCCSRLEQCARKLSTYAPYAAFILLLFTKHPVQERILDYVKVQSDTVLWFQWQFGFVFNLLAGNNFSC